MSHERQIKFCEVIKCLYPSYFKNSTVIDAGSLDINGNNKHLFTDSRYTGVDIIPGKNVDLVCSMHMVEYPENVDTIISTEMLEHDKRWTDSLSNMYDLLRKGGLLIITCATKDRKEHGTRKHEPEASPGTLDWYRNIGKKEFKKILRKKMFSTYYLKTFGNDLNFYGIKK